MKVGYVLRYWPTLSETFVAREIDGLRARGIEVEVVALGARADAALAEPSTVPVVRPPRGWRIVAAASSLPALLGASGRRALRPRDQARAAWVGVHARRSGWDRVHAHFVGEAAEFARVVAAVAGVPWSVTAHAVDLFVPRPTVAELLREARPAITVCEHHRAYVARTFGVEVAVVRCGAPLDVPQADPGSAGLRVVCVARDVPKKGLDDLVHAVGRVPGATLRLVSDAARLARPGVEVGPVRPSEVPAALAAATVFALPCRVAPNGDRDGVPVALLEAMAAGLPVVSTAVSGVPEVVDDAVGWLVPPDDPDALVGALTAACDPAERARRGEAARSRVRAWSIDAQVDGLVDAWRRG